LGRITNCCISWPRRIPEKLEDNVLPPLIDMASSYKEFVGRLVARNPSLMSLLAFLNSDGSQTLSESIVSCIETDGGGNVITHERTHVEQLVSKVLSLPCRSSRDIGGFITSLVVVIDNLHPADVETLGSALDINPLFFGGHIASSYQDIERSPAPPLMALLPSQITSQDFFTIHYHRVLDLGEQSALGHLPYKLVLPGNIPRVVRRVPPLSGREIGLVRSCCSVLKKKLPNGTWICNTRSLTSLGRWETS
jgi:hypothetical protein